MKDVLNPKSYDYLKSSVSFETSDKKLKELFDKAEAECLKNKKKYNEFDVLEEGEKYNGVWMETQPMGGEMYAKRDIKTALGNILIFLRMQRKDGKYPGMIMFDDCMGIKPYYDWMQGLFLPYAGLKMYYLTGKEEDYLKALHSSLKDYDEYLWKYRDSDGDGCLETWCIWDTGEDNFTMYEINGVDQYKCGSCGGIEPPEDAGNFPVESPQYMAYSYAARDVLSKISKLLNNGEEKVWEDAANKVKVKFKEYLWDEDKKACFPRDKDNKVIDCLSQENIKCMYEGIFDQDMADSFIREHLLNENEFWTPYPIPSVAVNNPYFHCDKEYSNCYEKLNELGKAEGNIEVNNWSGPINGLTCQRSIDALLNYNHHAENILIGEKIIKMLKENKGFVQNYNPFTGKQHGDKDGYGPTILAFLEYISVMYGVNISYDTALWTGICCGGEYKYTQEILGKVFTLSHKEGKNTAFIDGKYIFEATENARIKTDFDGKILYIYGVSDKPSKAEICVNDKCYKADINPNSISVIEDSEIKTIQQVDFKF